MESKWAGKALEQGRVTPDMKWIDIKIKDLKVKINEQSVEDAKEGLYDIAEKELRKMNVPEKQGQLGFFDKVQRYFEGVF